MRLSRRVLRCEWWCYLTCLYRICAAQKLKAWRVPDEMASAGSAVGAEELHRVLTEAQYDWFLKQEAHLLRQDLQGIFATLREDGVLDQS